MVKPSLGSLFFFFLFLFLVFFISSTSSFGSDEGSVIDLVVDEELEAESFLVLDTGGGGGGGGGVKGKLYRLQGLKPKAHYEVRISYPGVLPARFTLTWKSQEDGKESLGLLHKLDSGHKRTLLDTEKIMFSTDQSSRILSGRDSQGLSFRGEGEVLVLVEVELASVSPPSKHPRHITILYNIVLEELFYDIPYPVWRVVVMIMFGVSLLCCFLPRLFSLITSGGDAGDISLPRLPASFPFRKTL